MDDILSQMPREGFLKTTVSVRKDLSPQQRVQLIRRGNEFYNKGDDEMAGRIFLTLGYKDGITRLGDRFYERGEPLEALRMYRAAGAEAKVSEMVEQMAQVVKKWLKE